VRSNSLRGNDGRMDQAWPTYLLERASEPPPEDCNVVPGSTPVVSFGHPLSPKVATLGINPSSAEFLAGGRLLEGKKRRLATLTSIEAASYGDIDEGKAAEIIDECATYFRGNPYRRWFDPLNTILYEALGASYYDETACHLDLVQWATDPIWKELRRVEQERLLDGDQDFLRKQLKHEGYRVIVVNGATAMGWVQRAGIARWKHTDAIEDPPAARLAVSRGEGALFLGWSCNLQSQPGARRHVGRLVDLLERYGADEVGGRQMETYGDMFERGTHFRNRHELVAALKRWVEETTEETIGDLKFKRAPWISFDTSAGVADLNADTRRDAVERMLRQTSEARPWHVIENRRGSINKVVFELKDSHEGWYAYLRQPIPEPTEI
jgi:hypothetical protein